MSQSDSPVALECRGPSLQTVRESGPASLLVHLPAIDPSQRFYRCVNNPNPGGGISSDRSELAASQRLVPLEETRENALHTLALCRNVIITLELTRLRKTRTGFSYWLTFWERLYEPPLARCLCSRVAAALSKVDGLFRAVSHELHQVTSRMEAAIGVASSEKEILHVLERMEEEVGVRRRRRRKKAQSILEKMRVNIEAIPVKVSDELFDDLKRGVFALDVFCDYHPGDPAAEANEMMCQEELVRQPVGSTAVSPYHYQAFAASGQPMRLRPHNNGYDEELINEEGIPSIWRPSESSSTFTW